jgi:hypothetical protein
VNFTAAIGRHFSRGSEISLLPPGCFTAAEIDHQLGAVRRQPRTGKGL